MIIAIEDIVGDAVARRLVSTVRPDLEIKSSIGNRGKGYLKGRARELNRTSRSIPVLLLIDLDTREPCPAELIPSWVPGGAQANMLFRAAVMEVESWLLADRKGMAGYLSVPVHRIPMETDSIDRPKEFIVNLSRKSRSRKIREDIVPSPGAIVTVGPAYNLRLVEFAASRWNPEEACGSSDSLRRAVKRLKSAFPGSRTLAKKNPGRI